MGKISWGALCLLFLPAGRKRCADPDGGHRCLATVSYAGEERRLPGAGYRHSAPVAGTQRHCAHPQTGALGTGTQTDADRSGGSDDRAGSPRSGPPSSTTCSPSITSARPAFYGKPAAVAGLQALRDLRSREIGCNAQLRLLPSMATPSSTSTGSAPPKTSCSAWWAVACPDDKGPTARWITP